MSDSLTLRELVDQDVPLLTQWLYTPHVAEWYHDPQDWLDEVGKRHGEFDWLRHYLAQVDGRPIGFCQYYEYCKSGEDWHGSISTDGAYSLDYMIGDSAYLKKGYGKALVKALIEKIRTEENAARILGLPEFENDASCHTLLSCGFVFDVENRHYRLEL